jgi:cell division protein FtsL
LFKELSADSTLDDYCRKMQQSQTNRQVAIILLVLLFVSILAAVAWQLMQALNLSARRQQELQDKLDLLCDELQRLTLEENALHVSNAVLDNTLSTLKHETMYYPSRIRQLIDSVHSPESAVHEADVQPDHEQCTMNYPLIKEVAAYYRELYGLFSAQAMRQVEHGKLHLEHLPHDILGDKNLVDFLFEILKKESGQRQLFIDYAVHNDKYVECRVAMPSLRRIDLFTPSHEANIPFLLCRQIVRDHGEATNRRACAISAEWRSNVVHFVITLPRALPLASSLPSN